MDYVFWLFILGYLVRMYVCYPYVYVLGWSFGIGVGMGNIYNLINYTTKKDIILIYKHII